MSTKSVSFYLESELQRIMSPDAKRYALTSWYRRMFPMIPFESGLLAENVTIDTDGIHFRSPQAQYLYEGLLMVSPTTGSAWAKKDERKVLTATPLQYSHEQHPLAQKEWGKVSAELYGDAIINELMDYLYHKE